MDAPALEQKLLMHALARFVDLPFLVCQSVDVAPAVTQEQLHNFAVVALDSEMQCYIGFNNTIGMNRASHME